MPRKHCLKGENMGNVNVYYKSLDGDKKVSANFQVKEFACRDGSDIVSVDMELVQVLQDVRDYFAAPVTVNSAFRTPAYNKKAGGVTGSQHIRGTAADIAVKGVSPDDIYRYLDEKYPDSYGIGKYQTFTHIDVRPVKARW